MQTEVTLSEFHKTIKSKINGLTAEQVSTLASNTGGSLGYSATTVMRWFEGRTAPHHAVHESLFSGIDAEKRKLRLK